MAEIYRNSSARLSQTLDGATNVSVSVSRWGTKLIENATPDASGFTYSYLLPKHIVSYDGPLYVRWDYTVGGRAYVAVEEHSIVTPLMDLPVGSEAREWERLVRHVIESYTKQSFGLFYGPRVASGRGFDFLELPQRLIELESIKHEDATLDSSGFVLDETNWYLQNKLGRQYTIKEAPPYDDIINAPKSRTLFGRGSKYEITGVWGYGNPPQPVAEACEILYNDYSCKDAVYRDRYLKEIRSLDWRMEFSDLAFLGVGSVQADRLLGPFVRGGGLVVV